MRVLAAASGLQADTAICQRPPPIVASQCMQQAHSKTSACAECGVVASAVAHFTMYNQPFILVAAAAAATPESLVNGCSPARRWSRGRHSTMTTRSYRCISSRKQVRRYNTLLQWKLQHGMQVLDSGWYCSADDSA
jgi:hypothetical protein